jgi:hypothetical protein
VGSSFLASVVVVKAAPPKALAVVPAVGAVVVVVVEAPPQEFPPPPPALLDGLLGSSLIEAEVTGFVFSSSFFCSPPNPAKALLEDPPPKGLLLAEELVVDPPPKGLLAAVVDEPPPPKGLFVAAEAELEGAEEEEISCFFLGFSAAGFSSSVVFFLSQETLPPPKEAAAPEELEVVFVAEGPKETAPKGLAPAEEEVEVDSFSLLGFSSSFFASVDVPAEVKPAKEFPPKGFVAAEPEPEVVVAVVVEVVDVAKGLASFAVSAGFSVVVVVVDPKPAKAFPPPGIPTLKRSDFVSSVLLAEGSAKNEVEEAGRVEAASAAREEVLTPPEVSI